MKIISPLYRLRAFTLASQGSGACGQKGLRDSDLTVSGGLAKHNDGVLNIVVVFIFEHVARSGTSCKEGSAMIQWKQAGAAMFVHALACGAFAQALPSGWLDVPFGRYTAGYEGWSAYDSGVFTVAGSGYDMYDVANDGGRFAFLPLQGDCEVVARVKRLHDALAYGARAGVMLRQGNDRNAVNAVFARMRGDVSNVGRITAAARLQVNITTTSASANGFDYPWLLMRLVRQGSTVKSYFSTNELGTVWELYNTRTVALGDAVNAGIFVCRNNGTTNALPLMTNEFDQVTVRQLVTVQTNAAAGFDLSWATDIPGISNGWSYTYTVTRTPEGGAVSTQAQDLASAAYSDPGPVAGTYYRYAVTAVPVDQPAAPNVLIGTSAAVRTPYAATNLVSGLPQGLYAAYYMPATEATAGVSRVESSVTNVVSQYPAGYTNGFKTVFNANLQTDAADLYTFFIASDDGVRMWLGDQLVMDTWYGGQLKSSSAPVWLEAGRSYPVRIEYYQNTGSRACLLEWRRAGAPEQTTAVPPEAFTPVPLPWRHEDIGDVAQNGNAAFDPGTGAITVTAAGNTLTNGADACQLVSRDVDNDFDFAVRLDALTGGGADRRAGVVLRSDLTPGAAGVALLAVPGASEYAVSVVSRAAAGAQPAVASVASGVATGSPLWLRLVRTGSRLTCSFRADGTPTWSLAQELTNTLYLTTDKLGLTASSAAAGEAAAAAFGGVTVAQPAAAVLLPTDDVYLQANDTNYGTSTNLTVRRTTGTEQRESFLRFNVAGLESARSAKLRLYVQSRSTSPTVQETVVRRFDLFDWREKEVRWSGAPGGLRMPTVFLADDDPTIIGRANNPAAGEFFELDISEAVRDSAARGGDLTLNLFTTAVAGSPVTYASKEYTDSARRPAIVYTLDVPAGLAADGGPEAGNISLRWLAVTGATAYRVYRATAAEGPYAQAGGDVAQATFKDAGLTAGQRYYYTVSAVLPEGETARSSADSAVAPAAHRVMGVFEDAYIQGGSTSNNNYGASTALTLKYNAVSTATHREAYLLFTNIWALGQAERVVLRVVPSTASPGDVTQIPLQFIRMPSNAWSESTVTFMNSPPGFPPPTPRLTGLPAKDRVTATCVAVGQTLEVDVTELVREGARVNADNKLSIGIIRLDDLTGFNCSLYSSEDGTAARRPQLVYTLGRTAPPAVTVSNGYAEVSWPPYSGATGYVLRRAPAAEGPYTVLTNTPALTAKDTAAAAGVTYYYTLTAVLAGGEAEASRPVAARVQALEARYPVADTMIESNGGSTATTLHGRDTSFNLKRSPVREDLFKFDVSGLGDAASVRFRVCSSAQDGAYAGVNIIVRFGDFGDWNEHGVTYAAPPAGYTPPSASTAAKGSNELARIYCPYKDPANLYENYLEADVTEAVRAAAQAGRRYLTLFLTGDDTRQNSAGYMQIAAREYGTELKRPVLLCSGSGFGAPQAVRAVPQPEAPGFLLTWREVSGAHHYVVVRQGPQDAAPVVVADGVTGTSWLDAGAGYWNDRAYAYTVRAVNADGTSAEAAASATLTRTFVRPLEADTFVRGGQYTNTSYGLATTVDVKGDGDLGYEREAFFRVAVSNVPEVTRAQLRLVLNMTNVFTDSTVVLVATNDTGWAESGAGAATWNSVLGEGAGRTPEPAPGDPSVIARFNLKDSGYGAGSEMLFDLTPQFKAAQARAEGTLMVQLFLTTLNAAGNFTIRSLQSPMLADIPCVLYTVAQNPAPGFLLLLK